MYIIGGIHGCGFRFDPKTWISFNLETKSADVIEVSLAFAKKKFPERFECFICTPPCILAFTIQVLVVLVMVVFLNDVIIFFSAGVVL